MSTLPDPTIPPRLANVPAFPPVVMKLLSLLADDNGSVAKIASCIATDPIFSARILKRANAADVATYEPRQDVLRALIALGMERTRELTLTIATLAYLGSSLKTDELCRCWRHTVACAMASAAIARACDLEPGEAYTAGLLHDIGRLGLITAYRTEYQQTISQEVEQAGDLLELERERFGVDHTQAGHWLAQRWGLPEDLANVALHHHDAPWGSLDTLGIVQVGCRLADVLDYSVNLQAVAPEFDTVAALLPPFVRSRLRAALPKLQKEIAEQIAFFGYSDSKPLVRHINVKIDEEEEQDFLADFGSPTLALSAPPKSDSVYSRRLIGVVLAALAAVLMVLLYR